MQRFPSREEVARLRSRYVEGIKIKLDEMDDNYGPPPGTIGTVRGVDDAGQIMVSWATGSSLSLIPGVDRFHIVENV